MAEHDDVTTEYRIEHDTMGEVRDACDALETVVADEFWPLPRYREMLFPV